jgi:hypothetical protein
MPKPLTFLCAATRTLAGAAALTVAVVPCAHAYIDPGTGSMVLQLLAAGAAAALFYLRSWRTWITGWLFGRKRDRTEESQETERREPD